MSQADQLDDAACAEILRRGSKSFHAASRLLPPRVRVPTMGLYAFCRTADDHVDSLPEHADAAKLRAVARLEARLDAAYAGRPHDSPVDRAFARVVQTHAIPQALPAAMLEGMRWDAESRDIPDETTLLAYSARVAAAVGLMMTLIMGERRPALLARACDLGTAMQLTNIARDVGEDARNGRVYLPSTWLEQEGLSRERLLAEPVFDQRLGLVIRRTLDRADALYARADAGIAELPRDCRRAILAARRVYAAIGAIVRRRNYDSVSQRAVVSKLGKLRLLASAWLGRMPHASAADLSLPPLHEVERLIAACQPEVR